jgi:hypothetical protein
MLSAVWLFIEAELRLYNTVKPRFLAFVGGLKKKRWIRENDRCGSLYKINKNQICLYAFTNSKNVHK